jgi:hypothetical protein
MTTTSHTAPRRPRCRPRWMAVSVTVVLLLGSGLLPAQAAPEPAVSAALPPGYEVVETTHNVTLTPGDVFFTTNTCPGGKSILGGGASLSLEPSATGAPSLVTNGPARASVTNWLVTYVNLGATAVSFGVRVTAVCASSGLSGLEQVSSVGLGGTIQPNSQSDGSVACPGGKKVIGGGVQTSSPGSPPPVTLPVNSSHGQGWAVTYVNPGSSAVNLSYVITAICVDPDAVNTTSVTPQLTTAQLAGGAEEIRTLQCAGSPLNGGITVWSVSPSSPGPLLSVVEDGPIPASPGQTTWRFRLRNYGTTQLRVQYLVNVTCTS